MKTSLLIAVTLTACLPGILFGQVKRNAVSAASTKTTVNTIQPCCGQSVEDETMVLSPREEIALTQLTIHVRIMHQSAAPTLTPGVHVLSTGPDGHKFQATVSRQGVVTNWFVTEPSGVRLAQVNSNDDGGQVDINRCMAEFLRRAEFCEWQGTFDSRYNYGRCYWEAWRSFLGCLERGSEAIR